MSTSVERAGRRVPRTGDAVSLRTKLRREERRRRIRAIALITPLLLFLLVTFVFPIGALLWRSVHSPEVVNVLPRTVFALGQWDGKALPGEGVFAALAADLGEAKRARTVAIAAKRLNYDKSGFRSLLIKTARRLPTGPVLAYSDALIKIDKRWGKPEYWAVVKRASTRYTNFFLLAALDLEVNDAGEIVGVPEHSAVFIDTLIRTFWISFVVTGLCVLMAYPIAHLLATVPTRVSNLLLILVMLPFWTSLLVRTTAWVVLLQTEGVVNDLALSLGLFSQRVQLIHNRIGVYVAMTHILLPFMVLPLFAVMKGIPAGYMRAARSLGAGPVFALWKVYLPQTVPGLGAGCLLVFIMALGYYITPALVGGPRDQMLSYFIAYYANQTTNWSMSAALSVVLLLLTVALVALFSRLIGFDKLKLG